MAEDGALWAAIAELRSRLTENDRLLATHLGECGIRHQEVIRRQEESRQDRSQLRTDLAHFAGETRQAIASIAAEARVAIEKTAAEARTGVERSHGWTVALVLSIGGVAITGLGALLLKLLKVY